MNTLRWWMRLGLSTLRVYLFVGRISREERCNPTAMAANIPSLSLFVGLRCSLGLTPNPPYGFPSIQFSNLLFVGWISLRIHQAAVHIATSFNEYFTMVDALRLIHPTGVSVCRSK